jgi:hypothetical protein
MKNSTFIIYAHKNFSHFIFFSISHCNFNIHTQYGQTLSFDMLVLQRQNLL